MNELNQIVAFILVLIFSTNFNLTVEARTKNSVSRMPMRLKTTPAATDNPALMKKYQQTITPEDLSARLYFLASDFFEGRGTGTRGQQMAAQYLASQYRTMGLAPKGNSQAANPLSPSPYMQTFSLYRNTPQETRLEVMTNGSKTAESVFSTNKRDDLSFYLEGGAADATGGVVFAGYGIADDALGYNDFAALSAKGVSIKDKWVLMLADEPLSDATTSLLPTAEHKLSRWTTGFADKKMARWKIGEKPKGILIISDLSPRNKTSFADAAATAAINTSRQGTLSYYETSDVTQTYNISAKFANQILASSGQKIEALKQQIDQTLKPEVFEIRDVIVNSKVRQSPKVETENVLAFIEGSDPKLKDEVVVISAHYDHLGQNPLLTGDQIFNGAADDGSGTVATLALAQAFMNAKRDGYGPRRSILFANFTAEEVGTLGSFHYASFDPKIPLAKTVANINMDGIGGVDSKNPTGSKDYVYMVGMKDLSEELFAINQQMAKLTGSSLKFADASNKNFGSDHSSFGNQLIPNIYYSTGRTDLYHTVNDSPESIDYNHMTEIARLVFATAWQTANQNARISRPNPNQITVAGYVCPPCGLACDVEIKTPFAKPGVCPVCGMSLIRNFVRKN